MLTASAWHPIGPFCVSLGEFCPVGELPEVGISLGLGPGSRPGPYESLAPLGAGGMGEVFRARAASALGPPPMCAKNVMLDWLGRLQRR